MRVKSYWWSWKTLASPIISARACVVRNVKGEKDPECWWKRMEISKTSSGSLNFKQKTWNVSHHDGSDLFTAQKRIFLIIWQRRSFQLSGKHSHMSCRAGRLLLRLPHHKQFKSYTWCVDSCQIFYLPRRPHTIGGININPEWRSDVTSWRKRKFVQSTTKRSTRGSSNCFLCVLHFFTLVCAISLGRKKGKFAQRKHRKLWRR